MEMNNKIKNLIPYYEEPNIKIYCGDCLEVMKEFPDKYFDCVITSPPYNMRLHIRDGGYIDRREFGGHFSIKYKHFQDGMPMDKYYKFHSNCLKEMLRISDIVFWVVQIVTGSKEALFNIIGDFSKQIRDIIIWDKGHGQPAINKGVLNRGYEMIIIFENGPAGRTFNKYYFNRGELQDVWRFKRDRAINEHRAVFPVGLVKKILYNWTRSGDTILDPFLGSGITLRACKDLGRKCIGIEISQEYCDIAVKRLGQEVLNFNE